MPPTIHRKYKHFDSNVQTAEDRGSGSENRKTAQICAKKRQAASDFFSLIPKPHAHERHHM